MTKLGDWLPASVAQHLGKYAEESGAVLLTSRSTIRPGRFYIMGFNPGGVPEKHPISIAQSVANEDLPAGWSAHVHDCWKCNERPDCQHLDTDGRVRKNELKPHQKRVQIIHQMLGVDAGESMVTNAVFARSTGDSTLKYVSGLPENDGGKFGPWQWWAKCWPVHQAMLAEVRPEWIITLGKGYGTSAFAFLANKAKKGRRDIRALGDDSYNDGRMFEAKFELHDGSILETKVLGLPHPSYYAVGDELVATVQAELRH